jgi:hypothetical protein
VTVGALQTLLGVQHGGILSDLMMQQKERRERERERTHTYGKMLITEEKRNNSRE